MRSTVKRNDSRACHAASMRPSSRIAYNSFGM